MAPIMINHIALNVVKVVVVDSRELLLLLSLTGYRSWNSGICLAVIGGRLAPVSCVDDGNNTIS